jgi:putative ABC transport system permease protein
MTANRSAAPPRLAEALVALLSTSEERPFVVGDFRDAFDERAARLGAAAARAWYWREVLRSLAPLARTRWRATAGPNRQPRRDDAATDAIADVRYALRLSRRSPLASLAIVTTMALGIASTTAVFSATHAVLLRPLPFPGSDRVVELNADLHGGERVFPSLAYPDLMDFRHVPDFADLSVFSRNDVTLQHGTDPQLVHSLQVDNAYARVFALRTALGRLPVPSDTELHAPKVTVLSYDFWMREFGGDRSLVGSMITLDNESVQVVGVLAADAYIFPRASIDLLVPLVIRPNTIMNNRGAMWAGAAATLKPTASVAQAGRDIASVAARIAKEYPNSNEFISARVKPLREAVVGSVQSMLELLAAAVAAVLLIACVNIANLILGRAQIRSREFAVRSALGGSPARVRRQVLTESLVLASIGGVLGVLLAPALTHMLVAVYPDALPRAEEIGINVPVIFVALAATIAAGVLSAIPTTRRVARLDLADDLRDGGRSGGGRRDRSAGRTLVVTQVAASLALLFSAGLLLQTFWRLTKVKPGFEPRHAVAFHVFTPGARYKSVAEIDRYYDAAIGALHAIPGVRVVSSTTSLPFGKGASYDAFIQEERGDQGPNNPSSGISVSTPDFERALGMPLLRGRSFTKQDDSTSERVVMINEIIAKRNYPGQDPVGHFITWNGQPHWRIVGVLGAVHFNSLSDELLPVLYVPAAQAPRRSRYLVVRSDVAAELVIAAARVALRGIDPTIALTDIATMDQRIERSLGAERFRAVLMATLGALALALAVIGIYGVVAYSVSRRTREIGIRMALGEASHDVRRRVVLDAFRGASAGIAIGLGLALASGKWLTVFLVGVSPYDRAMLAVAAGLIAAVVVAAAYGPARRAARVDPMTALRAD